MDIIFMTDSSCDLSAEIAKEIYNGTCSDSRWSSWGNGTDRVNRLKQAGYDPSEVQSEVNKLF